MHTQSSIRRRIDDGRWAVNRRWIKVGGRTRYAWTHKTGADWYVSAESVTGVAIVVAGPYAEHAEALAWLNDRAVSA